MGCIPLRGACKGCHCPPAGGVEPRHYGIPDGAVCGPMWSSAPTGCDVRTAVYSSSLSTAMNASDGTETVPKVRIRFLPSFCFSSSFFLRVMSPP